MVPTTINPFGVTYNPASLARQLEEQISDLGYEVRVVTLDEISADPHLRLLMNEADQPYNEVYAKIVNF